MTTSNNNSDQIIYGTIKSESLRGGNGNDRIYGAAGNDWIDGGKGNDYIDGGAGNDDIDGGDGNDILLGGAGNDKIDGGSGNDIIDGGSGIDDMEGDCGNDTFVFRMSDHIGEAVGSKAAYSTIDGGGDCDTLLLTLTRAEWLRSDVQADVARFLTWLRNDSCGDFVFTAFNLKIKDIESLTLVVDGLTLDPRDEGVTARADAITVTEDAPNVAFNLLANDSVPDMVKSVTVTNGAKGTVTLVQNYSNPASPVATAVYTPNATAYQYLAAGERATDTFTYTVTDADGDVSTATVTVTILGVNDGPAIVSGSFGSGVTEDSGAALSTSGAIIFSDVDLTDLHTVSVGAARTTVSGNAPAGFAPAGGFGTLTASVTENTTDKNAQGTINWSFSADNAAVQALGAGQTATQVYTLTLTDRNGATVTRDVTITITGTNDAAAIGVPSNASVQEDTTVSSGKLVASGTIAISDVDQGQAYFVSHSGAPGSLGNLAFQPDGSYTYSVDNAVVQYLGAGQTKVDSFTVVAADGTSKVVQFTITGTNDAPTIASATATGAVTEDGTTAVAGNIAFADVDIVDTHSVSFAAQGSGYRGTFATVIDNNATGDGAGNVRWTFAADNAALQDLAQGQVLTQQYAVTVKDNEGATVTQIVTVTITGTNDAPVAQADVAAPATEDGALVTGTVAANDSDVDQGAALSYALNDAVAGLTLNANGTYSFNPGNTAYQSLAQGEVKTVVASYAVKDEFGATATSTLTLKITGTNDGPVAVADVAATTENAAITVDVLANDTDLDDGHVFTLTSAAAPAGRGVASVIGNQLVFTPGTAFDHLAAGVTEVVAVSYTMQDDQGAVSTSTLTITITGTNDAPVAVADVASAIEDGALVTGSVAANDSDVDDNATHSFALDAPVAGLTLGADGSYSFDSATAAYQSLAAGEQLVVVANYTITDDQGATAQATLTVTLTGTNDAPVVTSTAADAAGTVRESGVNDAGTPSATGQLASSDVDRNATATWSGSADGSYGRFAVNAAGAWAYIIDNARASTDALAAGETVVETFLATVTDDQGTTATQAVTITITGTNDAPIAMADVAAGTENQTLTINVLANDTDVDDGHVFTLLGVVAPAGKGLAAVVNNRVVFAPGTDFDHLAAGATETVTLTYVMQDEFGATSASIVTITVTGTNDAPAAGFDAAATTENATIAIDVLANDTDVDDGNVLTVTSALVQPDQGSIAVVANQLVFTPGTAFDHLAAGDTATVVVFYSIEDDKGAQSAATVTITVTGTNDAPIAVADVNAATEDTTIAGTVAANDSDVDDGAIRTFALNAPVAGLTLNSDGSYSFDASNSVYQNLAQGATRVVTASYTVTDDQGATAVSTLTITVTGTNDTPVAVADVNAVAEDASVSGNVRTNDSDVDTGAALTYTLNAPVAGLTLNANGTYSFNAANPAYQALALGEPQIVVAGYTVTDQFGATSQSTLTITVTGRNDAPVAVVDTASAIEDGAIVTGNVGANDSDADNGAVLTYSTVTGVAGLTINANGSYSFDPSNAAYQNLGAGATRVVTATYRVTDQNGASATSTLAITVTGTNDAPVVGNVTLLANRLGNGGFDATPNFAGWTITNGSTGTTGTFTSTATIDRTGTILPGDNAVAVLNYSATTPAGYGTGYGPSIKSDAFAGNAGDVVSFTYKLSAGSDQAVGRAYIRDAVTGAIVQTIFNYQVPFVGTTGVQTVNVVLATSGSYTIDFQVGSYDASGGRAIGARLDIGFAGILANGISEDAAFTFGNGRTLLLANSTDIDVGDVLTVAPFTTTSMMGAAVTLAADGSLVVDPRGSLQIQALKQGESAVDTFTFTVSDGKGGLTTGTASVTIVGANDAPVANADTASTTENQAVTVAVLANDTDIDHGAVLTLVSASAPAGKGSAAVSGNQLIFAPGTAFDHLAAGASETVVVTYLIKDEFGATSTSTATITVLGTNDAPVAVADIGAVDEDATLTGSVAANDSDVDDGAALGYSLDAPVAGLTLNADGSYSFNAGNAAYQSLAQGQTQVVTASYTVTDDKGATATATLAITVTGANDAPTAIAGGDLSGAVVEPATSLGLTSAMSPVIADTETNNSFASAQAIDRNALRITATDTARANPNDPALTVTGSIATSADDDYFKIELKAGEVLTLDIDTNRGVSALDSYVFVYNSAGQLIASNDDSAITAGGTGSTVTQDSFLTVAIPADGVYYILVKDYDIGGQASSGSYSLQVSLGSLSAAITDTGTFDFADIDLTDSHTVSVAANGTGYLGNLTAAITNPATGDGAGIVKWDFATSNAAINYLAVGETLTQNYTVTVTDTNGAAVSQVVTITITGTNDAPIVTGTVPIANYTENAVATTGSFGFSDADTIDAHNVTVSSVTAGNRGTLTATISNPSTGDNAGVVSWRFAGAPGAFDFLAAGETRQERYNIALSDGHGGTADQLVIVTITGTNDAPVVTSSAANASGAVIEAGALNNGGTPAATGTLTESDADNGAVATWSGTAAGVYGSFAIDAAGVWTYTLDNNAAATQALSEGQIVTETFTTTVSDGLGGTATQLVTIQVTGAIDNRAPTAAAVSAAGGEDAALINGTFAGTDPDAGDTLSYEVLSQPGLGTVINNNDGTFGFQPGAAFQTLAAGETWMQTFTYRAVDRLGSASAPATVAVTITGANDAPVITSSAAAAMGAVIEAGNLDDGTVAAGVPTVSGTLTSSDVDTGATATWSVANTSNGTYGSLALTSAGVWTYTLLNGLGSTQALDEGQTGTESFTVRVSDGQGGTATQVISITVTGTNDRPSLQADVNTAVEDGSIVTGSVRTNDTDVDAGAVLTYTLNAPVAGLTLNADGSYSFNAANAAYQALAAGATQNVVASYTATDQFGASATSTLTITVTGANDAPVAAAAIPDRSSPEDTAWSYTVPAGTFTDIDSATLSYAALLSTGAALPGWLIFNAATRTFSGTPPLNYSGALDIRVTASDGALSAIDVFTLTVTAVNDAPVGVDRTITALEDTALVLTAANFAFTDVESNALASVKITTLPTAGTLALLGVAVTAGQIVSAADIAAGRLTFIAAANGNGAGYANFTFQVQDNGGTANGGVDTDQTPNTMTINVTAVNDAVTDVSLSANIAPENVPSVTVGVLTAADVDVGDTFTYSIRPGLDAALFTIVGNELRVGGTGLDYEQASTRQVTVRVTDSGGAFVDRTFTIQISDSNEITLTTANDVATTGATNDQVLANSLTLNPGDQIATGGGTDELLLFGSGTFNLSTLTTYTGVETVRLINLTASTATLTLKAGVQNDVIATGTGATSTTLNNLASTFTGSDGADTVSAGTGNVVINTGANNDSVNTGSGTATVDSGNGNDVVNLSTGAATVVTGQGSDTVFLGAGLADVSTGIDNDSIYVDRNGFNAGSDADGGQGSDTLIVESVRDLTGNTIVNMETLSVNGTNGGATLTAAQLAQFTTVNGSVTARVTVADATVNLTGKSISNVNFYSTNAAGTLFRVSGAAAALQMFGGTGADAVQVVGAALSADQRDILFAVSSIETLIDSSGTYNAPAATPGTIKLTTGADTIPAGAPADVTVNATATTLTTNDVLDAGATGTDVLAIYGTGTFNMNSYNVGGFEEFRLINNTTTTVTFTMKTGQGGLVNATGTGNASINLANAAATVTTANGNDTVTASSGSATISTGAGGDTVFGSSGQLTVDTGNDSDTVYADYNGWNAASSFNGGQGFDYIRFYYGARDLTATTIINFEYLQISGDTKMTATQVQQLSQLDGSGYRLNVAEAAVDLTNKSGNATFGSLNATGTTFKVNSVAMAFQVMGGAGTADTLDATAITLTAAQRQAIFNGSLIETIIDVTGSYAAPALPAGTIRLTTGNDALPALPDSLTILANTFTLTAGDSLNAGATGTDTLALYGAGQFNLGTPSMLLGFEAITLENNTNSQALVYLRAGMAASFTSLGTGGVQLITADTAVTVTLGSGNDFVQFGTGAVTLDVGGGNDTVYGANAPANINMGAGNDTAYLDVSGYNAVSSFNGGADFDYLYVYNSRDMTTNSITNFEYLYINSSTATLKLSNAQLAQFQYVTGGTGSKIITGDATFDLTGKITGSATFLSDNATGTLFKVSNSSAAFLVTGGAGQDGVEAVGFTFTADQRTALLNGSSVEYIIEGNTIYGGSGANTLVGGAAANTIYGNDGNDSIDGGAGADFLYGGNGNDIFVMRAGQTNGDSILDFSGNGSAAGDSLSFHGFGTAADGATFAQVDATHWQINSADNSLHEIITVTAGTTFHAGDYTFFPA